MHVASIDDLKAVVATVEPVHQLVARARIGGTVTALKIKEGDVVVAGAEIALVADQKLFLQMQALDQRIKSQQAQRDKAKADFDRAQELLQRGVTTKVMFDQAKTMLDVADRNLAAIRSDRGVIEQQAAEGAVLAPGAGRILTIPVSVGRAVMPGETIATLAERARYPSTSIARASRQIYARWRSCANRRTRFTRRSQRTTQGRPCAHRLP